MTQTLAEKLLVLYHTSRPLEYTESSGLAALEWSQGILKQLDAQNPPVEDPNAEQPFVFSESSLEKVDGGRSPRPTSRKIRVGTAVTWKYGNGTATGKVIKIYRDRITLKLGDSEITRNGTGDDPAILIEQENGARVLKLASEVKISTSDYAEINEQEKDPADLYTEQAIALAAPIFSEWLNQVESYIFDGATDLGEVRDRIESAFEEMDSKDFAALMQETLLASYGAGRYQVTTETTEDNE